MMWMRAEKSIIYGVDQYVSVDLIETKTVAPHKYFALTKVYLCMRTTPDDATRFIHFQ